MLQDATPGTLHTSAWTLLEFTSALARLQRLDELKGDPHVIERTLEEHARYVYTVHQPTREDYQLARELVLHDPSLGLRGPDALHLAITTANGETIYTLDRMLLDAATALGIPATNAGISRLT